MHRSYINISFSPGDGDQLRKSVDILAEMKEFGVPPNTITYSVLLVACEK